MRISLARGYLVENTDRLVFQGSGRSILVGRRFYGLRYSLDRDDRVYSGCARGWGDTMSRGEGFQKVIGVKKLSETGVPSCQSEVGQTGEHATPALPRMTRTAQGVAMGGEALF